MKQFFAKSVEHIEVIFMNKKTTYRLPIILLLIFILAGLSIAGCANGNVKPEVEKTKFEVPEDEFSEENLGGNTLENSFSLEQSIYRIDQVREALESFKKLTEKSKAKISKEVLDQVGNTGWEIQTLGFYNWPNTIEGTLKLQNYEIKKLEFELAIGKYENDKLSKEDVEKVQEQYENAKDELKNFLDSYAIAD